LYLIYIQDTQLTRIILSSFPSVMDQIISALAE